MLTYKGSNSREPDHGRSPAQCPPVCVNFLRPGKLMRSCASGLLKQSRLTDTDTDLFQCVFRRVFVGRKSPDR